MNKLASIYFLQKLGLPTIDPNLITETKEKKIRAQVDSFYFNYKPGWVLRCGEFPDENAPSERVSLPWAVVNNKEDLVSKIIEFQKDIKGNYLVFAHHVKEMIRGGTMLSEGSRIIVEAGIGDPKELSSMFRGYRSPEQIAIFKPTMISYENHGKNVLTKEDFYDMRNIQRGLNWKEISGVTNPVAVEFSRINDGSLYVHDLKIVS